MKVTLIAGSNRGNSSSTKALRFIARVLENKGVHAHLFDLWEKPLPFYAPDEEDMEHPHVAEMVKAVEEADGLVLGTPEYHGSLSGVLKNALDFVGSSEVGGKPVLSVSSSGGAVGVSSLTQMQAIVRNLHGINSPEWISLGGDGRRFDENGEPIDPKVRMRTERAVNELVKLMKLLRGEHSEVRV